MKGEKALSFLDPLFVNLELQVNLKLQVNKELDFSACVRAVFAFTKGEGLKLDTCRKTAIFLMIFQNKSFVDFLNFFIFKFCTHFSSLIP